MVSIEDWFYQNNFESEEEYMCTPVDNANHRKQRGRTAPNRALRLRKKHKKTMFEDFHEKHPNAPIDFDGTPLMCPYRLGYEDYRVCEESIGSCVDCWNRPIKDEDTNHIPDVQKVGE